MFQKLYKFMQELVFTLPPEEKGHGTISFATYYRFLRAGANVLVLAMVFALFVLADVRVEAWLYNIICTVC